MEGKSLKEIILYLVFGVLTTLVNFVVYALCARFFSLPVVVSNVISWFCSVLFAFVTNRIWVFESKASGFGEKVRECLSFFLGRLGTGVLDTLIMFISVDVLGANDLIVKILSNVIVIILNYVISKFLVFRE